MSTDNSNNEGSLIKEETNIAVDSGLSTQSKGDGEIIENYEITGCIDNKVISQSTNDNECLGSNNDNFVEGQNECTERKDLSQNCSNVNESESFCTGEVTGIPLPPKDANLSSELTESSQRNCDTEADREKHDITSSDKVYEGHIKEPERGLNEEIRENTDEISNTHSVDTNDSNDTNTDIKKDSDERSKVSLTKETHWKEKEESEFEVNPKNEINEGKASYETQGTSSFDSTNEEKETRTDTKNVAKLAEQIISDRNESNKKDLQIRGKDIIENCQTTVDDSDKKVDDNYCDKDKNLPKGDSIAVELQKPGEKKSEEQHQAVTAETDNENKEQVYDSHESTVRSGERPSLNQQRDNSIIDQIDTVSIGNHERDFADKNESDIQKELETVYDKVTVGDVTSDIRISSAPESTHESDRAYSTELETKSTIKNDNSDYEDNFEDVEDTAKSIREQSDKIKQCTEQSELPENNLIKLENDIRTAKTDWENTLKENKREGQNGGRALDNDYCDKQENNLELQPTLIVIEGDDKPQVVLSSISDRPQLTDPEPDNKTEDLGEDNKPQDSEKEVLENEELSLEISRDSVKNHSVNKTATNHPSGTLDTRHSNITIYSSHSTEAVVTTKLVETSGTDNPVETAETNNRSEAVKSFVHEDKMETQEANESNDRNNLRGIGIQEQEEHGVGANGKNETMNNTKESENGDFYDDSPCENIGKNSQLDEKIDNNSLQQRYSCATKDNNMAEKLENKGDDNEKPTMSKDVVKKTEDEVKLEQITKKQKSPLEQLLKQNVEIEGSMENINELEHAVTSLLVSMKSVMTYYQERLKLQALKDFTTDLGKFRGDFQSINDAYKRCTTMSLTINQHLKDLRHMTDDVKSQISKKFQNEDLSTWVDVTPEQEKENNKLQELTIAAEKAAMAKGAEARHAMAKATVGVAEAHQFATEMEAQSIEAEATATKAAAQAQAAIKAMEEARKAAEERKRAEEAAKKRAEERAKIKAEEEAKKREQEEMKIIQQAALKGSTVEDERKTFMEEKARKEAERRNPKNWPRFTYNVQAGDFDPGIGCVIRAIDGSMRKDDVTCEYINQSTGILHLNDHEELVSNIICVKQVEEDRKFGFEEPLSIALPVCNNRLPPGKEAVVKQLQPNGKWKTLPTADVQFEDYRELRFTEGRCRGFGTFVVVLTTRKDSMQFVPKGGKVVSSVDSRITISNKPGTFQHVVSATVEIQMIDVNAVSDLKIKVQTECDDLLTASPFVNFRIPNKKFEKPLLFTMPLPQNQIRQKRPATGLSRETKQQDLRPATARPASIKDDEEADDIHFLYLDDKNGWTKDPKCILHQPKNKDVVSFEMDKPRSRFILLRTKPGTSGVRVEKIACLLEKRRTQRNVKVFLRQRNEDPVDIKVGCTISNKIHRALKATEEDEGYTEGPSPSRDLVLQEGQQLYLKFRGNMKCVSENPDLTLTFNSYIRASRQFFVEEIDRFAQKGLQNYRGFVQVLTKAMIPNSLEPGAPPAKGPTDMVVTEVLLCELLIELPKPEAEPPKPLKTAPLPIREGPLTSGVLRYLAGYLGKEWKDLASHLNLKPMRIQAILRQNVNKDTPQTRFDMLMAWAKRVPRSVDKVQVLCSALQAVGRQDLVEEVRYRGDEFRQKRQMDARASHLRQAFVKVAKTASVFKQWQKFAKGLGVPEEDIKKIEESGGSGQEKCFNSLESWKNRQGEQANVTELATHLKSSKHEYLSREVESIMAT